MVSIERRRQVLMVMVLVLLVALWLGGGVTQDSTSIDEWLELLALPPLGLAMVLLAAEWPASRLTRVGIVLAAAIAVLLALQLLPLPESLWNGPSARLAIAADWQQAGVRVPAHRWSLAPAATEQGLWALLPALALFLSALVLEERQRRRLLQGVMALAAGNVLFAFFQAGLPAGSPLRLYQTFNAGFGGLFANTNHQATSCIIGMVLAVGLAADARSRARYSGGQHYAGWGYFALAGVFLLVVPLSTSRAGMAIALPALAAVLVMSGVIQFRQVRRHPLAMGLTAGMLLLAMLGMWAAAGWMAVDLAEEQRHVMAAETLALGWAHAPLGSGVGSFVPVFNAARPDAMQGAYYVNHAHNEYVQWWLETGVLGLLLLVGVLGLVVVAGKRLLCGSRARLAAAAWVAVVAVLSHSWADYPLRTLSLMATSAALMGVMLASLAEAGVRRRTLAMAHPED